MPMRKVLILTLLPLSGCVSTTSTEDSVDYSLPISAIGFWSGQASVKEIMGDTSLSGTQSWSGFISESGMVILTKEDDSVIYGDLDWSTGGEAEGTLYYHLDGVRYELEAELNVSDEAFTGTLKADNDDDQLLVKDTFTFSVDINKNAGFRMDVEYFDLNGDWYEYVGSSSNAVSLSNGDSTIRAIESNCTIELETQTNLYRYAEFYLNADLSNCVDSSHNGSYTGYMLQTQDETYTYLDAYLFNSAAVHHIQLRQ